MTFHNRVVQYCSSLGTACGIASYTNMLCEAHQLLKIKSLKDLNGEIPSHLHVQHEFCITPTKELKDIICFCKRKKVKFYITMHSVAAVADIDIYYLFRRRLLEIWIPRIQQRIGEFLKKVDKCVFSDKNTLYDHAFRLKIKCKLWIERFQNSHYFNKPPPKKNYCSLHNWIWNPDIFDIHFLCFLRRSECLIIKHADKIIVHSDSAKAALLSMGAKKVEVIPHALKIYPTSRTLFSNGKLHIGCFGFFAKRKRFLDIVRACEKLDNVILHLYASTANPLLTLEDKAYQKKLLEEARCKNWIRLETQHFSLDQIVYALSQCHVNIWYSELPHYISTSGSIRQYLAAKRPIIACDNIMIEDLKGILNIIPFDNEETLLTAIQTFNPDTKKIEDYVNNHTWEKIKVSYE